MFRTFFLLLLSSLICFNCNSTKPNDQRSKLIGVTQEDAINVKDYGAKGDGETDDTQAIKKALKALAKTRKHTLFFPEGVYVVNGNGIVLSGKKINMIGEGVRRTIIKGQDVVNLVTARNIHESLIIQGIKFDATNVKNKTLNIKGKSIDGPIKIDNCLFFNARLYNIWLEAAQSVEITNNTFRGLGNGKSTGVLIIHGCSRVNIQNNEFYNLYRGVYIIGYNYNNKQFLAPNNNISFVGNYLDFNWYLLPSRYEGHGKEIKYTANTIYDPSANFKGISIKDNVRLLAPLAKGAFTDVKNNLFRDNTVDFKKLDIQKHDLLRIDGKQTLIDSVINRHTLKLSGWISQENLMPVALASENKTYEISRIIIGKIKSYTPTKIEVWKFYDFRGNTVLPKAGWKYEVLNPKPNYPFFATKNNQDFLIKNNVFKRGWADQVAISGDDAKIEGNLIMDGQDMGITLHGKGHEVIDNRIVHQRTGVWLACQNSIFKNNSMLDCSWASDYKNSKTAYLYIRQDGNRIEKNTFRRKNSLQHEFLKAIRAKKSIKIEKSNNFERLNN